MLPASARRPEAPGWPPVRNQHLDGMPQEHPAGDLKAGFEGPSEQQAHPLGQVARNESGGPPSQPATYASAGWLAEATCPCATSCAGDPTPQTPQPSSAPRENGCTRGALKRPEMSFNEISDSNAAAGSDDALIGVMRVTGWTPCPAMQACFAAVRGSSSDIKQLDQLARAGMSARGAAQHVRVGRRGSAGWESRRLGLSTRQCAHFGLGSGCAATPRRYYFAVHHAGAAFPVPSPMCATGRSRR